MKKISLIALPTLAISFCFLASQFPAIATQFVYVATYTSSNSVYGFTIDPDSGALTPVPGSPFAAGHSPTSVAVDTNTQFAYVTNFDSNTVSGYRIDQITGALTPLPGSPFATGVEPQSIALTKVAKGTVQFVYVTNSYSNSVSGYKIDPTTGALMPVPGSSFATGKAPWSVAVDQPVFEPFNFVYVANQLDDTLSAYKVNVDTGALTPVKDSPFKTGRRPYSVTVSSGSDYVAVANSDDANYSVYFLKDYNSGLLEPVSGSPFPTGDMPLSIVFGGAAIYNDFIYVVNSLSNTLTVDNGFGHGTRGSPYATGRGPFAVAVDPEFRSRWVYVANASDKTISGYRIRASGKTAVLEPLSGSPSKLEDVPLSVVITRQTK
jgi:6-phosphogluconolactonase